MNTEINNKGSTYTVIRSLAKDPNGIFNLHECISDGKTFFFKIAQTSTQNNILEREEFLLGEILPEEADLLEREFKESSEYSGYPLNNHFLYPKLVDSFIHEGRKVLILSFENIAEKTSDMTPLSFITHRDRVVVDPRTSAWILGKLLKLLVFTHGAHLAHLDLSSDNILINKKDHYVALCHFHGAISSRALTLPERQEEIIDIASVIVELLGGNIETGIIPHDDQLIDDQYQNFLIKLLSGYYDNAQLAHTDFYQLIRSLWPRKFYPYTTKTI